jgi:hypothetical protein
MIDDVVAIAWPEDHRDHVVAEKPADFSRGALAQSTALGFDFVHADGDLRRPQAINRNWRQDGIANEGHANTSARKRIQERS